MSTSLGTSRSNRRISSREVRVPVGLLGLARKSTPVRGVIARIMAGISAANSTAGTVTNVAPNKAVTMGYTAKQNSGTTTSTPGRIIAWPTNSRSSLEPLPKMRFSVRTPSDSARARLSTEAEPSG